MTFNIGRFDPRNQQKYEQSPHCEYSEFISLKCSIYHPDWKKKNETRVYETVPNIKISCRFRVEYARLKKNALFILSNFYFHHTHPLSLEYES